MVIPLRTFGKRPFEALSDAVDISAKGAAETAKKVDFWRLSCRWISKTRPTVALVDELARRQGISKTAAIRQALAERLQRMGQAGGSQERLLSELRVICERIAHLPERESQTDEEIVGFNEHGIPN